MKLEVNTDELAKQRIFGGTPMYGSTTPGGSHGGRTPMYGSQTPMYGDSGSRTPHYGSQVIRIHYIIIIDVNSRYKVTRSIKHQLIIYTNI